MRTVILGERPKELEALIESRRATGADLYDEVWEGDESDELFLPTAALVVEIVSPNDESWDTLTFYAAHRVDEVIVVDPNDRSIVWMELAGDTYRRVEHSALLGVAVADVAAQIDWPPT